MANRVPQQPPFTAELLADLHADNVAAVQREQLWSAVAHDPEAQGYLRSLDDVSAQVHALGRDSQIIHPMPEDVAARLTRFVDDLDTTEKGSADDPAVSRPFSAPAGESDDRPTIAHPFAAGRQGRSRLRWLVAAAAIIVITGAGSIIATLREDDHASITAGSAADDDPIGDDLTATVALGALGRYDVTGSLARREALQRCVSANGLDRAVLGSTDFTFEGGNAVLILLAGPRPPQITALVVGTGCSTGDPQRKAIRDIG